MVVEGGLISLRLRGRRWRGCSLGLRGCSLRLSGGGG